MHGRDDCEHFGMSHSRTTTTTTTTIYISGSKSSSNSNSSIVRMSSSTNRTNGYSARGKKQGIGKGHRSYLEEGIVYEICHVAPQSAQLRTHPSATPPTVPPTASAPSASLRERV